MCFLLGGDDLRKIAHTFYIQYIAHVEFDVCIFFFDKKIILGVNAFDQVHPAQRYRLRLRYCLRQPGCFRLYISFRLDVFDRFVGCFDEPFYFSRLYDVINYIEFKTFSCVFGMGRDKNKNRRVLQAF
jgi:hypothetical protein